MLRTRLLTTTMTLILAGASGMLANASAAAAKGAAALPSGNPFAAASTLPFQAPPFDKIKVNDYQPAIEAGMRAQIAEDSKIAAQKEAPTFANTIEAMERSGQMLARVGAVFGAVTGADTNPTLEKAQEELAPKLAEHQDAIYLNDKLFQRVKTLFDTRATLGLDAEQVRLVERYYQNFVRAGAQLNEGDKTKLRALNKEESTLSTDFQNKLLAATNAGAVIVDNKEALAGFSEADIAAAADAAKTHMAAGKFAIVLQNTTQQPAQVNLQDRAVRERVFKASTERAEHSDANDTRAIVQRLAVLRADRAKLLGFPNFAAYTLDDQMAKTPEAAEKLMTDMVPAATAKARSEAGAMQALIEKNAGGIKLAPWDWQYYAEQVRKDKYDLDEAQVKPYFEINRVLNDGVFYAANQLYGLTFKERKDIPVWQPDVRVFEVFDKDGTSMALFYADYWKRDSKRGGAWMD
ncbi:MAG: M3 family metallopeptidase, partial [Dokdonella sp.]